MKKILTFSSVVLCAALLAACSTGSKKSAGINAKPQSLSEAISKADKKCSVDSDCVAVKKGCCMCAGYQAVNAKAAQEIQKLWDNECQMAACTLQMCYVDIIPSCKDNVCVGTPKPMDDYFAK